MGRVKLPISRILNNTNRQVTYSKRRNGLLKKAYEIAVLCDIDIALLMISPSGRISCFSGTKRIEDVLLRYFNLTDEERESDHELESVVCDKESVINTLIRLKTEEAANQRTENLSKQAEEYRQEILKVQHQLEIAKRQLRVLEPEKHKFSSLDEVESCEECLLKTLHVVEERKRHLLAERSSSYQETVEQINSVVQYIVNAQAEATAALENTALSSWAEQENKGGIDGSKNVSTGSDAYPNLNRNEISPAAIGSSANDDNMSNEGLQINNTREECLQQWNQTPAFFLSSYNTKHHFL